MQAILPDGRLLGRIIDAFLAQRLRGELEVSTIRPRRYSVGDPSPPATLAASGTYSRVQPLMR
jgi:hypothetical protein